MDKIEAKNARSKEHAAGPAHHKDEQGGPDSKGRNSESQTDSLVRRLRAGDRAAAAELVDLYYWQIYLYMRRLGHDRQLSEDLTQECFLNAWYHIGQLKHDRALRGWLYRIAGNVSRLYWRKHKGNKAVSIELVDAPQAGGSNAGRFERYEQLEQLQNAIDRLPAKLKEAVILHYMQHLTIAEAAQAAGIRPGTFKSRLARALRTLRKQLP